MSKKRAAEDAGIQIHVKREDFESQENTASSSAGPDGEDQTHRVDPTKKKVRARRPIGAGMGGGGNEEQIQEQVQKNNPFSSLQFGSSFSSERGMMESSQEDDKIRDVAALNASFKQWLKQKLHNDPAGNYVKGTRMYLSYCSKLSKKDGVSEPSGILKRPTLFSPASNGGPASTSTSMLSSTSPSFVADKSSQTPTFKGFGESSMSLFSNQAMPSTLFAQGKDAAPSSFSLPATGGLGLFSTTPSLPTTATSEDKAHDDGEEDGDELPQEPSQLAEKAKKDGETELYETEESKIQILKANEQGEQQWEIKGKGRLVVLHDTTTGKKSIVQRSATTGKVFFNAPLHSSMLPTVKRVKKAVTIMTKSYLTDPTSGEIQAENDDKIANYRIVVSSEDESSKLEQVLRKAMSS